MPNSHKNASPTPKVGYDPPIVHSPGEHESIVECVTRHCGIITTFVLSAFIVAAALPAASGRDGMTIRGSLIQGSQHGGFLRAPQPATADEVSQDSPILLPSEIRHRAAPEQMQRAVGVYLTPGHAGDEAYSDAVFESLVKAGMTAVVFDVKGSRVYFPSEAPMAKELGLVVPLVDVPDFVRRAKEHGLYTIARFIALKDNGLGSRVPATQIRHPKTNISVGSIWVDGGKEETLQYNREVLIELAQSGVDEINIDYIRYPTEYAPSQIGLTGNEKADRIEKFLLMAREVIDTYGPGTKLGISTFAILGWNFPVNFEPLGQDIGRFAKIVDVISPMAYPATFAEGAYYIPGVHPRSRSYYLVWRTLEGYKELTGPENAGKIRPWIQGYFMTAANLQDEIDAVYDAGLCGFTVWSAGNYYDTLYGVWSRQPDRENDCVAGPFDQAEEVE